MKAAHKIIGGSVVLTPFLTNWFFGPGLSQIVVGSLLIFLGIFGLMFSS